MPAVVAKFLGSLFGSGASRAAEQETTWDEPADELRASAAALDMLRCDVRSNGAEIPTVAYSQFRQLDDLIRLLIVQMNAMDASTEQRVLLAAIVSDYLPTSMRTYLMLGKSSRQESSPESEVLIAQLATLLSTTVDLDKQVRSGAATELAIHGRFLQDKFDLGSLHLEGH